MQGYFEVIEHGQFHGEIKRLRDIRFLSRDETPLEDIVQMAADVELENMKGLVGSMLYLTFDEEVKPCMINHAMTNTIVEIVDKVPEYSAVVAEEIVDMLKHDPPAGLRKSLSEVVDKLIWKSYERGDDIHFSQLLLGKGVDINVAPVLRYMFEDGMSILDESGQKYNLPGSDERGNVIVKPTYDSDIAGNITLQRMSSQFYYVVLDGNAVGNLAMYYAPRTIGKVLAMDINVFDKGDTGKGIGRSIMRWGAEVVGPGNYVATPTVAAEHQARLFDRCLREGIFEELIGIQSMANRIEYTVLDYKTFRIGEAGDTGKMTDGKNLFLVGKVSGKYAA